MNTLRGIFQPSRHPGFRIGIVLGLALALAGLFVGAATGAVTQFQKVIIVNARPAQFLSPARSASRTFRVLRMSK